jgi:uncharacterized YigZ family protein
VKKINTIIEKSEYQFKEKGSLFIGRVFPINSADEAESHLLIIRKKHYDASHNCYAYKFIDDQSFKYSDDGEPNGTAGIRILNAINHFSLSNVLIISTRYFGGTKLGVGPLGKAYYNSAIGAIENSTIIAKENYSKILIDFDYEFISDVHHFITSNKVKAITNLFKKNPQIECLIKPELLPELFKNLTAVSRGEIIIKTLEENIFI